MDATGLTGKTISETLRGFGWTDEDLSKPAGIVMVKGRMVVEPGKWTDTRDEKLIPVDDIFPAGAVLFIENEMAGTVVHDRGVWLDVDDARRELRYMLDRETMDAVRIAA